MLHRISSSARELVGDAMPAPLNLCDFVERPQSFGVPPGRPPMSVLLGDEHAPTALALVARQARAVARAVVAAIVCPRGERPTSWWAVSTVTTAESLWAQRFHAPRPLCDR
ncbi:hypothetical protein KUTG_02432 [Kutzneria sp. 744]|nr:hypothetical protein KUTG_02432 [Kutzneria sp. 744]